MAGKKSGRQPAASAGTERAPAGNRQKYVLKLYIAGMTARSRQALLCLEKVCRERPGNTYELEVVDIYQQPELAREDQIIAAPTLIKKLPLPARRLVGDLSREDRITLGLGLKPKVTLKTMTKRKTHG